jgi:hypothetical protein
MMYKIICYLIHNIQNIIIFLYNISSVQDGDAKVTGLPRHRGGEMDRCGDSLYYATVGIKLSWLWYKLQKKFITKRTGLLPLLVILDEPDKYQISINTGLTLCGCLIIIAIILFYFKNNIKHTLFIIFKYFYGYTIIKTIVNYYCFFLICIKGAYEIDYYLLTLIFIVPNGLYIGDVIFQWYPYLDNPLYLGAFFLSVGILFISLDELASTFVELYKQAPDHFLVVNYMVWSKKNSFLFIKADTIYMKGFFTGAGKLSAAGQAAIYGGILAMGTGVAVASINGYSNVSAAQAKYAYKSQQAKYDYKKHKDQKNREWDSYNKSWNPFKKPPTS